MKQNMHHHSGGTPEPLSYSNPQHQHKKCVEVAVALAKAAASATLTGRKAMLIIYFPSLSSSGSFADIISP